jgi:hypothetical protein
MPTTASTRRKMEAIYAALGRFVLAWADLESGIDLLFLNLRLRLPKGEEYYKPEFQLSAKIKIIRRFLPKLRLKRGRDAIIADVLVDVELIANTRHEYVHGAMIGRDVEATPATATLSRILTPGGRIQAPVTVTAKKIRDTARDVRKIAGTAKWRLFPTLTI